MYEYKLAELVNVVDGDTIDLRIHLGFGLTGTFRFRLKDIDAPEMYGKDAEPDGVKAAEFVYQWFAERAVSELIVETFKGSAKSVGIGDGAFGRWLCEVIDAETGRTLSEDIRRAFPPAS